MADFETNYSRTINELRKRIKELEGDLSITGLQRDARMVSEFVVDDAVRDEVRRAYYAGFDAGIAQHIHWEDRHEAFEAFKQQRGDR